MQHRGCGPLFLYRKKSGPQNEVNSPAFAPLPSTQSVGGPRGASGLRPPEAARLVETPRAALATGWHSLGQRLAVFRRQSRLALNGSCVSCVSRRPKQRWSVDVRWQWSCISWVQARGQRWTRGDWASTSPAEHHRRCFLRALGLPTPSGERCDKCGQPWL